MIKNSVNQYFLASTNMITRQKIWSYRKIILFGSSISSIGSISSSFLFKFPGFEDGVRVDLIIGFTEAILFPISPHFNQKSSHTRLLTQNLSLFRAPLIRAPVTHADMNNCIRDHSTINDPISCTTGRRSFSYRDSPSLLWKCLNFLFSSIASYLCPW